MKTSNLYEIRVSRGILTDTIHIVAENINQAIENAVKIASKDADSKITSDDINSVKAYGIVYY